MIQRVQSLWLLQTAVLCLLVPFFLFRKTVIDDLQTDHTVCVFVSNGAAFPAILSFVLSIAAIFCFKKRKLQLQLTNITYIWLLATAVFAFIDLGFVMLTYAILLVMVLAAFFNFLAQRGIRKDEALIRSLNSGRLR